tara:strand:- start:1165 stop:1674 length:510 start_codon:yes stop_codon:yes gene_type:complete
MKRMYHIIFALSCFLFAQPAAAQTQEELFNPSGLQIPRFVSLKSNKIFSRKGPGKRFPIEWVYQQKDLPVEIVQEFDVWRKIKDYEGSESWVHQGLLSGKRTAIALQDPYTQLYKKKERDTKVIGLVEKGATVELLGCFDDWCKVEALNYKGWIEKKNLWGIYESEKFQ